MASKNLICMTGLPDFYDAISPNEASPLPQQHGLTGPSPIRPHPLALLGTLPREEAICSRAGSLAPASQRRSNWFKQRPPEPNVDASMQVPACAADSDVVVGFGDHEE